MQKTIFNAKTRRCQGEKDLKIPDGNPGQHDLVSRQLRRPGDEFQGQ